MVTLVTCRGIRRVNTKIWRDLCITMRATPWVRSAIRATSPNRARWSLRPIEAWIFGGCESQGVALGFNMAAPWVLNLDCYRFPGGSFVLQTSLRALNGENGLLLLLRQPRPAHRFDVLQRERGDCLRLHIDDLDAVIIRVGDVHLAAGNADAAGLVERFCLAVAQVGVAGALDGVDELDFAVVGIGDEEFAVCVGDAEGVLQADIIAFAVLVAEFEESFADDGVDGSLVSRQGQSADGADLAVGDEEAFAIGRQA